MRINLVLEDSFFEEETRCGYTVSSEMKKIWAVELDLLNEFSKVCQKHQLNWFVHAGTLLGAIRHKGFIPWDDDIDVAMPRSDYDRLCELGPEAFGYPYFFQTEEADKYFCRNFARLRNSQTTGLIAWEKEFKYPYNQGIFIDIFPMDNIPEDASERKVYFDRLTDLNDTAWQWRNMVHFYRPKTDKGLRKRVIYCFKHLYFKYLSRKKGDYRYYLKEHHDLVVKYNDQETKYVGESIIAPLGRWVWKREWVDRVEMVPFEMLMVPVPVGYEECLKTGFGEDWRTPRHVENLHGNVIFDVEKPYTEYIKQ